MMQEQDDHLGNEIFGQVKPFVKQNDGTIKTVLVVGANGHLGRYVCKELRKKGYSVRAVIRGPKERLGDVLDSVASVISADVTDDKTLDGLCNGIDAIVSCLGVRIANTEYWTVDFQAHVNILNRALLSKDVKHFFYISYINGPLHRAQVPHIEARERVIDVLRDNDRYGVKKLRWTIFRPSALFKDMIEYLQFAWQGKGPIYGEGTYKCNPIHAEDLAEFMVATLSDPVKYDHQELTVGGPEVFTAKSLVELGYKIYRRPTQIKSVSTTSPDITTVSSLLQWANACANVDNLGTKYGTQNLEKFLRHVYAGVTSKARVGFLKITVHARNYHDIFLDDLPKGTGVRWEFVTEDKDIGFQVFYPGPSGEIKQSLINMEKAPAHETPQIGQINAYDGGNVVVRWDNTYSRMTKKVVHYKLEVIPPKVIHSPESSQPILVDDSKPKDEDLEINDAPTLIRQSQLGASLENLVRIANEKATTGEEWPEDWQQ